MIAAAVLPRHCQHCNTTWATCVDHREYRSAACCERCDHDDDRPRLCTGCEADQYACAVKAGHGGRVCCPACSHVVARAAPNRAVANRQPPANTHKGAPE